MVAKGDRETRIKDAVRELSLLLNATGDLRKYLSPDIGGLNVKQSQGILALTDVMQHVLHALAAINEELNRTWQHDRVKLGFGDSSISIDQNGEIVLVTGSASIRMKKDGSIDVKGKDIRVTGTGDISIKAAKDLNLKGAKVM
jgi:hypothetical protein